VLHSSKLGAASVRRKIAGYSAEPTAQPLCVSRRILEHALPDVLHQVLCIGADQGASEALEEGLVLEERSLQSGS